MQRATRCHDIGNDAEHQTEEETSIKMTYVTHEIGIAIAEVARCNRSANAVAVNGDRHCKKGKLICVLSICLSFIRMAWSKMNARLFTVAGNN